MPWPEGAQGLSGSFSAIFVNSTPHPQSDPRHPQDISCYAHVFHTWRMKRRRAAVSDEARHGVDRHTGETTDDGSVDPDELQIAADVQLDALCGLLPVP